VKSELAAGQYEDVDRFVEMAVQYFLNQRQRSQHRLDALRRIGQAVDQAGLYERVLVPESGMSLGRVVLDARVLANFSLCDTLLRPSALRGEMAG
jgi:Arc/MetJ-type ribon-helix-helix transcriptional regulator